MQVFPTTLRSANIFLPSNYGECQWPNLGSLRHVSEGPNLGRGPHLGSFYPSFNRFFQPLTSSIPLFLGSFNHYAVFSQVFQRKIIAMPLSPKSFNGRS